MEKTKDFDLTAIGNDETWTWWLNLNLNLKY